MFTDTSFFSLFFFFCVGFDPQDIQEAHAGQIVAVFGVDCASGLVLFF